MKHLLHLISITLFIQTGFCQAEAPQIISSTIDAVTLFKNGAQIFRTSRLSLIKGRNTCILSNLSPFIDPNSIRIDGNDQFDILTVQLQEDILHPLAKSKEIDQLNRQLDSISAVQSKFRMELNVVLEQLNFLKSNRTIQDGSQPIDPSAFKEMASFYHQQTKQLSEKKLTIEAAISNCSKKLKKIEEHLGQLQSKDDIPSGSIQIKVESTKTTEVTISFNYLVNNASWYPSYDLKYIAANKPIQISYKANISQETGIDWANVNITLSTAQTNVPLELPILNSAFVRYHYPTLYQNQFTSSLEHALFGKVNGLDITNSNGALGSGNKISIRGSSSIKSENQPLYVINGVPISASIQGNWNPEQHLNSNEIESIQVLKDASATSLYGARAAYGVVLITTKEKANNPSKASSSIPMVIKESNEVSAEYHITGKQDVRSNGKVNTIKYKNASFDAVFEHQTIPKLSKHIYLTAKIANWQNAGLQSGRANIFAENAYLGESTILMNEYSDSLTLSFGIDNNLSIKREKLKELSSEKILGNYRKNELTYELTIRNNKSYPVNIKLMDQIPLSEMDEIKVEISELSNGSLNEATGIITWHIPIMANSMASKRMGYSIKYPKHKNIVMD